MKSTVTVLGGGSWGTALALHLATSGNQTALWVHDPILAQQMAATRENTRYLPGHHLPGNLRVSSSLMESLEDANDVLIVIPSHHCRHVLTAARPFIAPNARFCVASKGVKPTMRVYGAEPLGADDAARSKAGGVWVPQTAPNTIADGLMTSLGQLTWPLVRDCVDGIFTVTEDQIRSAMRLVWERMKLVIEPSAAVVVAVILSEEFKKGETGQSVGVVFSGGNVSLDKLYW